MRRPFVIPALLAVLLTGTSSCLSITWTRQVTETAIRPDQLEQLPEDAELADCLALFGAPLFVWEDARGAHAIAYGWLRQRDLGARFSIPVTDSATASFQYTAGGGNSHGLVLFFDSDWRLQSWRFGFLRDLAVRDTG